MPGGTEASLNSPIGSLSIEVISRSAVMNFHVTTHPSIGACRKQSATVRVKTESDALVRRGPGEDDLSIVRFFQCPCDSDSPKRPWIREVTEPDLSTVLVQCDQVRLLLRPCHDVGSPGAREDDNWGSRGDRTACGAAAAGAACSSRTNCSRPVVRRTGCGAAAASAASSSRTNSSPPGRSDRSCRLRCLLLLDYPMPPRRSYRLPCWGR